MQIDINQNEIEETERNCLPVASYGCKTDLKEKQQDMGQKFLDVVLKKSHENQFYRKDNNRGSTEHKPK